MNLPVRRALSILLIVAFAVLGGRGVTQAAPLHPRAAPSAFSKKADSASKFLSKAPSERARLTPAKIFRLPASVAWSVRVEPAREIVSLASTPPSWLPDRRALLRQFCPRLHRPSALPDA
jgi:hypothetical protein